MSIDEIIAKLRHEAAGPLRSEQQIAEEQREAQEFGTELGESTLRFMRDRATSSTSPRPRPTWPPRSGRSDWRFQRRSAGSPQS